MDLYLKSPLVHVNYDRDGIYVLDENRGEVLHYVDVYILQVFKKYFLFHVLRSFNENLSRSKDFFFNLINFNLFKNYLIL